MITAIVVSAIAIVGTLILVLRASAAEEIQVSVGQIPAVVSCLKATGKDSSFVVFLFQPEGRSAHDDDDGVNLQYSIENGRVGLDWVLLAPLNVSDQERISAFMKDRGFAVNAQEMNKVRYLRVEDGPIADLGVQIATDVYRLKPADRINVIVDGFDWKSDGPAS